MKNSSNIIKRSIQKYFWIFIMPIIVSMTVMFLWPFIWGVYLSFFKFKTLSLTEFVGFDNYIAALSDKTFLNAFSFSFIFTIVTTLIINTVAFILAIILNSNIKGKVFFRTIFFMPNLVGGIVLAYIFKVLLNHLTLLLFNIPILSNVSLGFWSLVIILSWQQIGYMMVLYIAALQNVNSEILEASLIDGANKWQRIKKIIIPMITPSIGICLFLSITNSFKLFDQNLALTNGQPDGKTEMLALNIYRSFYQASSNLGVGQAKAVMFFVIVVLLSIFQLKLTKEKRDKNVF